MRDWQHPSNMSRLIKAITDMMDSYHGNAKKGKKSESFSRSEFKKLIQQEFAPVKRSPTSKYRYIGSPLDSDTEPMNKKERGSAKACVY
uniref:S100/CaBP-9k-type calcium binding subdomain domain-containing protein n=2 Tax=Anser brachyrhynchus TaxID=132585 RepID=A0A8B9B837_9AVES